GNWRGLYVFTSLENYLRVAGRQMNPATGRPYPADFLRIFFGRGEFRGAFQDFGGYLQDSIRLSPRVSLYAGLRYEAALMPQPPVPNPVLPFTSEVPGDLGMWLPRIGLSWSPGAGGRTVVRLGRGYFPRAHSSQGFKSNGNPEVGVTFD